MRASEVAVPLPRRLQLAQRKGELQRLSWQKLAQRGLLPTAAAAALGGGAGELPRLSQCSCDHGRQQAAREKMSRMRQKGPLTSAMVKIRKARALVLSVASAATRGARMRSVRTKITGCPARIIVLKLPTRTLTAVKRARVVPILPQAENWTCHAPPKALPWRMRICPRLQSGSCP